MLDRVSTYVEDFEVDVGVKSRDLSYGVVREVQFFQVHQLGETSDRGEAIGLYRKALEVDESVEAFDLGYSVFS